MWILARLFRLQYHVPHFHILVTDYALMTDEEGNPKCAIPSPTNIYYIIPNTWALIVM